MGTIRQDSRADERLFRIDPARAALVVVDMQHAFLAPGAPLEVPAGRAILPAMERLIGACRDRRMPVIWTQIDSTAPLGGMMLRKFPAIADGRVLDKGTTGFGIFAGLRPPRPDDYFVVKHKYDSFHQTDLDTLLRNLRIETLIICGVTTNCCCESTARSAFERDYNVAIVSDATAAFESRLHDAALGTIAELFGRVLDVDGVIAELQAR
jgi:ureidoacrylate peracid hydrolase